MDDDPTQRGAPIHEMIANRYETLSELGHGSQAHTFLARRRDDGARVAIKELDFGTIDSWKSIELFEREAEVLRSVHHPQIPTFIDSFQSDGSDGHPARFFLVESFVEGETVAELIDSGEPFDEAAVVDLAAQVLPILDYIHRLAPPIVHRDIKPANLIRRPDRSYSLVDFGGAQVVLPADTGGSTIIGTTGYMAPEQLIGRACPPSDLYALGATMIHVATAIAPSDLPQKRMRMQWRDHTTLSEPLENFIDEMVAPAVEERFQSAAEALRALQAVQTGSGWRSSLPTAPVPMSSNRPVDDGVLERVRMEDGAIVLDLASRFNIASTVAYALAAAALLTAAVKAWWLTLILAVGFALLGIVSSRKWKSATEELWVQPGQRFRLVTQTGEIEGSIDKVWLSPEAIVLVDDRGVPHYLAGSVDRDGREALYQELLVAQQSVDLSPPAVVTAEAPDVEGAESVAVGVHPNDSVDRGI